MAALLHDTVEDTDTSFEELEARFGLAVTALVREMTDDKSLPKEERKEAQVRKAPGLSARAKLIKLSDKRCNVRDITRNPPADWSLARRRAYLDWTARVVAGLRGTNAALEARYDETLARGYEALAALEGLEER